MDLITLSIPVYNVEEYVKRSLLSALNQTYENIEYLIVNDKGSGNLTELVRDITAIHPRGMELHIVEHPVNIGIGASRNTAIENASGKYICFMDSDDELTPDCIEKLYEGMRKTNVDVVCGSSSYVSVANEYVEKNKEEMVLSYFNGKFPILMWNKLYKLSFLHDKHIRCIPYQTVEDNYFTFQVLLCASSYSIIPDTTYFHHVRWDSAGNGGKWGGKVFEDWTSISVDLLKLLQKSTLDSKLKIKVKKRLFKRRWGISALALKSPYNVQYYINDYLSPALLKDKDMFRSAYLFIAYLFSNMPFWFKKMCLSLHAKFVDEKQ
ncbi:MAG: glycosyltransferase family 2 protein [Prevotellaceae bacterium]|jgi:glycosyltransferase involved in cell wall biosynthesis|nr:glycosyltransferase family 2 protein [Prevotellaceae bacterium]